MVKKRLNKKKILILTLVFVILLILLILILNLAKSKDEITLSKEKLAYINGTEWNNEIYPKGMPAFIRTYSGKQTAQNIGKNLYYVVIELIPKYNKNLKEYSEKELKEYFEDNRELILTNFGITTERDFLNLMDEILKIETNKFNLQNFYIDEKSIKKEKTNTKATLYIKYEGVEQISISIKALNIVKDNASSVQYY